MFATCESCVLKQNSHCIPLNRTITPENTCPLHSTSISQCTICNQQMIKAPIVLQEADNHYELCGGCASAIGTCQTCSNIQICELQTDNSMPTVIRQRIQQNGMIIEKDTVNPAKIEKCCRGRCKCFSEEFGCLKQNGTCGNYSLCELD